VLVDYLLMTLLHQVQTCCNHTVNNLTQYKIHYLLERDFPVWASYSTNGESNDVQLDMNSIEPYV